MSGAGSVRSAAGFSIVIEFALRMPARIQMVLGGNVAKHPLQVAANFLERVRSLSDGGAKDIQQFARDVWRIIPKFVLFSEVVQSTFVQNP